MLKHTSLRFFFFISLIAFLSNCRLAKNTSDVPESESTSPTAFGLDPTLQNEFWWPIWLKQFGNKIPKLQLAPNSETSLWSHTPQDIWWTQSQSTAPLSIELRVPRSQFSKISLLTISQWIYFLGQIPPPKKFTLQMQTLVQKLPPLEISFEAMKQITPFEIGDAQKNPICSYLSKWIQAHQVLNMKKFSSTSPVRISCFINWANTPTSDPSLIPFVRLARLPLPIYHKENQESLVLSQEDSLNLEKLKPILEP